MPLSHSQHPSGARVLHSLPGADTLIVEDVNTPGYSSIAQIASDILKF